MDNHTQRIDTAAIRALADAASPGPFWWEAYAYSGGGHVYLACRRPGLGVCKVMDFVRWGFGGASPRFWKDGLMERADALSSFDHNRRMTIHNADAEYIPAALTAVPALCDEVDALREQLDAAQTALVDAETVKRERDALRDKIADYEQTCGDLCPTCGWRGLRGDPGECAFCGNAELSARAHNAERKIAKLRELAARYNGSGPHIDIDGEEACTEYDGAKFAMQQVLAILDEVNNA